MQTKPTTEQVRDWVANRPMLSGFSIACIDFADTPEGLWSSADRGDFYVIRAKRMCASVCVKIDPDLIPGEHWPIFRLIERDILKSWATTASEGPPEDQVENVPAVMARFMRAVADEALANLYRYGDGLMGYGRRRLEDAGFFVGERADDAEAIEMRPFKWPPIPRSALRELDIDIDPAIASSAREHMERRHGR